MVFQYFDSDPFSVFQTIFTSTPEFCYPSLEHSNESTQVIHIFVKTAPRRTMYLTEQRSRLSIGVYDLKNMCIKYKYCTGMGPITVKYHVS